MYVASGIHQLTRAALVGLAAFATASSVLVPLTRQGLLPSFVELTVPLPARSGLSVMIVIRHVMGTRSVSVTAVKAE